MNKVFFVGGLTADPALGKNGAVRFTIASDTIRKDDDGKPLTNYYNTTVFGKLGETCAKYLKRGNRVTVVGDLVLRSYKDKEGVERQSLSVTANSIDFHRSGESKGSAKVDTKPQGDEEEDEDTLPF